MKVPIPTTLMLLFFVSTVFAELEVYDNSSDTSAPVLHHKPHILSRTKRQAQAIGTVGNGFNIIGSVWGSVMKLLETGTCCRSLTHDFCGDGTRQEANQCCGNGPCNIACCNCDNGCRRPPDNAAVAVVFHHRGGKGSNKAFPIIQGECWNMEWWNDKISDILAIGCITIWEHLGCTGASQNVVGRVSQLREHTMKDGISWDDQISSLSFCGSPQ